MLQEQQINLIKNLTRVEKNMFETIRFFNMVNLSKLVCVLYFCQLSASYANPDIPHGKQGQTPGRDLGGRL